MFDTLAPFLFLAAVTGGTALAIALIRRNTQRKIDALADYPEGDVPTDKLVESE